MSKLSSTKKSEFKTGDLATYNGQQVWVSDVIGNEAIVIPVTSGDLENGDLDTSKEFSVSIKQLKRFDWN